MTNDRERWIAALERYGVTLGAVGGALRGPCPFHRGSNPTSFVVTPEKGFHCFACGVGGGLSQFIQRMGGEAPARTTSFWRPVVDGRSDAVITPIGPLDAAHPYLAERGYWFQREVPRKAILFNLHRVKAAQHDTVVLVEGVFDAAAVHQLGMPNVVASLSCQVSANQRALLSRFRRVFVLFDADAAGAEATRALEEELGPSAVRVALPKADPCSLKGVVLDRLLRSAMESDGTSIPRNGRAKGLAR